MDSTLRARFSLMAVLILAAAAMRIVPHPPNFSPVAAIALFGGAHFDRKAWAFIVPLGAMLLSDVVLQLLYGWGFHTQMPIVYLTFAAIVGLGLLLRGRRSARPVIAAALGASLLLYLTTNFGVWAMGSLYPKSASGLLACYIAALPFLGWTVLADLCYSALLFGVFAFAERRFRILAPSRS